MSLEVLGVSQLGVVPKGRPCIRAHRGVLKHSLGHIIPSEVSNGQSNMDVICIYVVPFEDK